jgi:hypothetical protein
MAARAALTRPRRSRSLRSAARSFASRESSGRPLVVSQTVNREWIGRSSPSSLDSRYPLPTAECGLRRLM